MSTQFFLLNVEMIMPRVSEVVLELALSFSKAMACLLPGDPHLTSI